jgi:FMN phosphatase YigB (HAD superfamily)
MHELSNFADGVDGGQIKGAIPITTLFLDSFTSSCFVHVRKPDADIFRLALDIAQAPARQVVYIENTPMFVQIAEGLGMRSILHTDYRSTCAKRSVLGLKTAE